MELTPPPQVTCLLKAMVPGVRVWNGIIPLVKLTQVSQRPTLVEFCIQALSANDTAMFTGVSASHNHKVKN